MQIFPNKTEQEQSLCSNKVQCLQQLKCYYCDCPGYTSFIGSPSPFDYFISNCHISEENQLYILLMRYREHQIIHFTLYFFHFHSRNKIIRNLPLVAEIHFCHHIPGIMTSPQYLFFNLNGEYLHAHSFFLRAFQTVCSLIHDQCPIHIRFLRVSHK